MSEVDIFHNRMRMIVTDNAYDEDTDMHDIYLAADDDSSVCHHFICSPTEAATFPEGAIVIVDAAMYVDA